MASAVASKCCCFLENKQDRTKGPGIIFDFGRSGVGDETVKLQELQSALPGIRKAGTLETTCAILVCHSIIPGICSGNPAGVQNHLTGGILFYKGCSFELDKIVSGSVSCCGMDSIIGPGDNVLQTPHVTTNSGRNYCTLGLDFTLLFLKNEFVKNEIASSSMLINVPYNILPLQDSAMHHCVQSNLVVCYLCGSDDKNSQLIEQHAIKLCASSEPPPFPEAPKGSLREQINNYVARKRLYYQKLNVQLSDSDKFPLPPGGAIILIKEDSSPELIGFHVQKTNDNHSLVGNTIYGIIHLLRGGPVPVMTVLKTPDAGMPWPHRWTYLLTPYLAAVQNKSVLLELLHMLFTNARIAKIKDKSSPPEVCTGKLELLSSIFKQLRKVDGKDLSRDSAAECQDIVKDLEGRIKNLLTNILTVLQVSYSDCKATPPSYYQFENGSVKACLGCLNVMMDSQYEGITRNALVKEPNLDLFNNLSRQCIQVEQRQTTESTYTKIEEVISGLLTKLKYDNCESLDQTKAKHLSAVEKAMNYKGVLEHTLVHGSFVGPTGSGKTSLMMRLVGEMPSPTQPSTGVADKVVQVEVTKSMSIAAAVNVSDTPSIWLKLGYDEEAIRMITLASHIDHRHSADENTSHSASVISSGTDTQHVDSKLSGNIIPLPMSSPLHQAIVTPATSRSPSPKNQDTNTVKKSNTFTEKSTRFQYESPLVLFKNVLQGKSLDIKILQQKFNNSWSLYLTDTGGQMEFQELLPLLVYGPSVFFITFRLNQELNQRLKIEYRLPERGQYQSSLTLEEAILQTLASIASMGQHSYEHPQVECSFCKPKAFIVGTHKDMLDNATADAKIKEIDKHLQKIIRSTSHYHEDIVEFASEHQLIFTVNNFSEDDSDFENIKASVEKVVLNGHYRTRFPSHWLIFSLVLRQEMIKDPIISYNQCFAIAKDCGLTDHAELDHALQFLHTKIGLVCYFSQPGLKEYVIRDPQVLFDQVTQLITNTFTFENVRERRSTQFKKKGIFSIEDLKTRSRNNTLPAEKFLQLLEHLRIVAPYKSGKESDGPMYFIPCILAHSDMCTSQPPTDGPHTIPPMLVTFKCGFCPKGLPGALIAYLLNNEMRSKYKWELQTDQIFRDQVSFRVSTCDTITMKIHPTFLEFIHSREEDSSSRLARYCNNVRLFLKKGIAKISSDVKWISSEHSITYYCQNDKCNSANGPHPATEVVERDKNDSEQEDEEEEEEAESEWKLLCRRSGRIEESSPPAHFSVWFGKPYSTCITDEVPGSIVRKQTSVSLSSDDSGLNLRSRASSDYDQVSLSDAFRILLQVANEWQNIAILLGLPHNRTEAIRKDCLNRVNDCLRVMLNEWLLSDPHPTWEVLAKAVEPFNQAVAKSCRDMHATDAS